MTRQPVSRISVSLPPGVARELDRHVAERGFGSRSSAITRMIEQSLLEARREGGDTIMMGTITLFFHPARAAVLAELAALKRRYVDEVIGTLQVQLEKGHLMEVILVQGPAAKLQRITDRLVACSGVRTGKLTLTSTLIPPLHPLPAGAKKP
jgi:CopG family nickel-responsive transcriptional regulator